MVHNIGLVSLSLCFIAFGILFVAVSRYELVKIQEKVRWPTIPGVTRRSVIRKLSQEGVSCWTVDILYEYEIAGKKYISEGIAPFADSYYWENEARKVVAKYPPGGIVIVYYNPKKHSQSLLEPAESRSIVYFFKLGVTITGVGLVMILINFML